MFRTFKLMDEITVPAHNMRNCELPGMKIMNSLQMTRLRRESENAKITNGSNQAESRKANTKVSGNSREYPADWLITEFTLPNRVKASVKP